MPLWFQIDKDGASPDRVMQELSQIGLMPEDWGGNIPMVQVLMSHWYLYLCLPCLQSQEYLYICAFKQISALKGENVDDLLETVMLVAEVSKILLLSLFLHYFSSRVLLTLERKFRVKSRMVPFQFYFVTVLNNSVWDVSLRFSQKASSILQSHWCSSFWLWEA